MVTYLIDSKADLAKRDSIQAAIDDGDLPVMTTITKRPSDQLCWLGIWYGGSWYPPTDPRGAELAKIRYMLPAPTTPQEKSTCGVCGADARLSYSMPRALMPRLWYGSCCRDAIRQWLEVRDLAESMSISDAQRIYVQDAFCRTPEPAKPVKPVLLGSTEIEMGNGQYHRPGLSVRHSSQEKRLFVTQYINGRTGKQKNYYPLHTKVVGDQVEISTQGAAKSVVSLAEWQTFIDQVEVRVCSISQNTVKLTPELIKMARDVRARRRKEPTDTEWRAETAVDPKEDPGALAIAGAVVKEINQEIDIAHLDKLLADLVEKKFKRWIELEYGKVTKSLRFMNLSCEQQAFGDAEKHFRKLHNRAYHPPKPKKQRVFPGSADFDRLMPKYRYSMALANRGHEPALAIPRSIPDIARDTAHCLSLNELSETLHNHASLVAQTSAGVMSKAPQPAPAPRSEAKLPTPRKEPSRAEKACRRLSESKGFWDAMWQSQQRWLEARKAGEAKRDEAVRAAALKPASVLPQQLQSKEEVLEAIAMSKVEPSLERLTELYEAVIYGVKHYDNEPARIIFDGFFLRASESGIFIHLAHSGHPNHVTVGMKDLVTNKMEFSSSRGELKDFMHRVSVGMAPTTNGKLPGILMQAPIPDDAKQEPLRSGNNQHAEIAPDELPLFAGENPDPETAA